MERANVNAVELEYKVEGVGEPVLLIGTGPVADSFLPFFSQPLVVDRFRLITYHRRGQAGSSSVPLPVSFETHAADAAALLTFLGVQRAHVAGHSSGGDIALQLAGDYPDRVHSLALLEPALMTVPSGGAFFQRAEPSLRAFAAGDHEAAVASFMSLVCSLDWETCRTLLDRHTPGGAKRVVEDAAYFFQSELPALGIWEFGPEQAGTIAHPVLSVLGTESERLFVEGRELLHSWFPQVEDCTVEGVAHLLHVQRPEPVASGVAEFFRRHPLPVAAHAKATSISGTRPQ